MKQVICVDPCFDTPDNKVYELKKDEIYTVDDEKTIHGCLFYHLIGERGWFTSKHFTDITNLEHEINKALKAPTPKKKVKEHLVDAIGYILPHKIYSHGHWKL